MGNIFGGIQAKSGSILVQNTGTGGVDFSNKSPLQFHNDLRIFTGTPSDPVPPSSTGSIALTLQNAVLDSNVFIKGAVSSVGPLKILLQEGGSQKVFINAQSGSINFSNNVLKAISFSSRPHAELFHEGSVYDGKTEVLYRAIENPTLTRKGIELSARGEYLIDCNTTVKCMDNTIHCSDGTILLAKVSPKVQSFTCLYGNAWLKNRGRTIALAAGMEITIGSCDSDVQAHLESDGLARRRWCQYDNFVTSEVSFISLANKSNLIRLIYSDNSRVKMKSKIMKAAASLNIVTSKHGPYKTFRSKEII